MLKHVAADTQFMTNDEPALYRSFENVARAYGRRLAHEQRRGGQLLITVLLQPRLGTYFDYPTCIGSFGLVMQLGLCHVIALRVRTGRL